VWRAVFDAAPDVATVWVASSMPIRDAEAYVPSNEKRIACLSNRGANGIDGTIASATGAALAGGEPTLVLIGDVALLHDIGGLLAARRLGADLTVVCANNGGGNIFDHLPVAASAETAAYEEHIVTPTGIELERVAALADMPYTLAESLDELTAAIETGPGLIEVRTDRARNVELHRDLRRRVEAAL
jgi:2-succinyl-5-enolpyruvyl-6-hydroxy-3-cyclohexene-1-carboxylate synthase